MDEHLLAPKATTMIAPTATHLSSVRLGLAVVAIFFGAFGTWMTFAPLDGAVVSTGALTVHGNNKTVQHKEGGIVASLLVQEGDHVTRDQVLIRLDDTQTGAILHVHLAQLAGDEALCARDLAELSGAASISFPADLGPLGVVGQSVMSREQVVFDTHRNLMAQQQQIIDERIKQARQQSTGAIAQHEAAMRGLAYGTQQLQALSTLEKMGLAGRNTVLELQRSVEALRGETGQLQSEIARHAAEAAELEAEKLRLRAAAAGDATHELREAQLRINDVIPRIVADRDLLARLEIRAPASGRVVDLQAFTKGGVIEPGKAILQIVPETRAIVALTEIRPEDVEYLHTGQIAHVIATGFNARNTPAISGRVEVISADRIVDPRTGRAYYTAEVTLLSDNAHGKLLQILAPGMPVEVVVPVKARTVLDYLLEPLKTSMRSAGREM